MSFTGVLITFVLLTAFISSFHCRLYTRAKNELQRVQRVQELKLKSKLDESKSRQHFEPLIEQLGNPQNCARRSALNDRNLSISCHGGLFQQTSGFYQTCREHSDCYDWRESMEWCPLDRGYLWTDWGCHCDPKIGSCIIERHNKAFSSLEWSYCTPKNEFQCRTHRQ